MPSTPLSSITPMPSGMFKRIRKKIGQPIWVRSSSVLRGGMSGYRPSDVSRLKYAGVATIMATILKERAGRVR